MGRGRTGHYSPSRFTLPLHHINPHTSKNQYRCWRLTIPCKPREAKKKLQQQDAGVHRKGAEEDEKEKEEEEEEEEEEEVEEMEEEEVEVRKGGGTGEGAQRAGPRPVCRQHLAKQNDGKEQQQQQRRWWERQREGMMHPSLIELCFHRHNPRLCAQTYLEVFHQVLGEGLMDKGPMDRAKNLQVL